MIMVLRIATIYTALTVVEFMYSWVCVTTYPFDRDELEAAGAINI